MRNIILKNFKPLKLSILRVITEEMLDFSR